MLLSFLPVTIAAVGALLFKRIPNGSILMSLCILAYVYGFILAYCFFRWRERMEIAQALFNSFCAALIFLMLNALLIVSVLFVGCVCAVMKK